MNRKIDLRRYCSEETVREGEQLLQGVTHQKLERLVDGSTCVSAKVLDFFHFVSHASATVSDGAISDFHCDCPSGRKHHFCQHIAALLLYFDEALAASPAAEEPEEAPPEEDSFDCEDDDTPSEASFTDGADVNDEEPPEEEPFVFEDDDTPSEAPLPDGADANDDGQPPRSMEVLFGQRMENGEAVYWRPNDTEQVFHTNMGIIGTMGTGKTQFTKSLIAQMYRQQKNNFDGHPLGLLIFDYKGDYNGTKTDFCKAVPACVLTPYMLPYNPLALNRTRKFRPLLPLHTANVFKDTVSKIYGLGHKQQQTLLDCIMKAYEAQGIDPENEATWSRKPPTFAQVYQIFERETEGRMPDSLTAAMNKLQGFHIFESDSAKAQSLANVLSGGVVVVDLSGDDEDIQNLVVAITLDQFYAQMQTYGSSKTDGRYRQLRSLILVDEADNFMSQGFPSLRKIMKEGREFGVGVILSTQSLSHFVGGDDDYSRYVLTWVVHNVSDLRQRDVEYVFKLQPKSPEIAATYGAIKGLSKHEGIVKFSEEAPFAIRDLAFWQLCREWGIS
ncbi:MAG: DUF87 domain-containing protein [Clostridiales bacterium]|nr:DUF87 domain-containing protein [Clostridiales bacterium]